MSYDQIYKIDGYKYPTLKEIREQILSQDYKVEVEKHDAIISKMKSYRNNCKDSTQNVLKRLLVCDEQIAKDPDRVLFDRIKQI